MSKDTIDTIEKLKMIEKNSFWKRLVLGMRFILTGNFSFENQTIIKKTSLVSKEFVENSKKNYDRGGIQVLTLPKPKKKTTRRKKKKV